MKRGPTVCVTGGADWQDSQILWHETLQTSLRILGRKPRPVHAVLGAVCKTLKIFLDYFSIRNFLFIKLFPYSFAALIFRKSLSWLISLPQPEHFSWYQEKGLLQLGHCHIFSCSLNQYSVPFSFIVCMFLGIAFRCGNCSTSDFPDSRISQGKSSHNTQC